MATLPLVYEVYWLHEGPRYGHASRMQCDGVVVEGEEAKNLGRIEEPVMLRESDETMDLGMDLSMYMVDMRSGLGMVLESHIHRGWAREHETQGDVLAVTRSSHRLHQKPEKDLAKN